MERKKAKPKPAGAAIHRDQNLDLREFLRLRKQAEESARGVERRFRVVADSLNEMILYVDAGLRIRYSNRAYDQLWGIPREDLIGRYLPDMIGRKAYRQRGPYLDRALGGQPTTFEGYLVCKGRKTRYVRADFIPDLGEDGKVAGLFIVKKDLTDLKQAEEKFQTIIDSAPDAMILIEEDGKIALVNSATERLFGHQRADLAGQLVEILVPNGLRERHVSHRELYYVAPKARLMGEELKLFGLRKDGSEFPVEVSLSPLRTNGTILTCAIVRDISSRLALEQQRRLAEIMEERGRMARDVHDTLAQGFAGIVVQLQAAEASYLSRPEEAFRHVTSALELAQTNLNEARRSVLSLSEGQVEAVNLPESLEALVGRLRTETTIPLQFSIHGTPRRLDASIEENLLGIARQAINNSIQHSQAKEMGVELAFQKARVRLRVSDDGRGFLISLAGDGFGLKSMRDRARQCGAKLDIVSKRGQGTRITITVPIGHPPREKGAP